MMYEVIGECWPEAVKSIGVLDIKVLGSFLIVGSDSQVWEDEGRYPRAQTGMQAERKCFIEPEIYELKLKLSPSVDLPEAVEDADS